MCARTYMWRGARGRTNRAHACLSVQMLLEAFWLQLDQTCNRLEVGGGGGGG